MSKPMDVEQLPSCHHFEGDVTTKSETQVIVPEARQSLIRKKVRHDMFGMIITQKITPSSLIAESFLLCAHSMFYHTWTEVSS